MLTAVLLLAGCQADLPLTVPEASNYTRTSSSQDVRAFLESLEDLPHSGRLAVMHMGRAFEGRPMQAVLVGDPPPSAARADLAADKLRILVNGNIHGGEVEGKESIQVLLREFASGKHSELLEHATIAFVPIYNVDGNDRIARTNRVSQNGPDGGVGERANAQGFDLNRDFIKAESPECRALLALTNAFDPHLWMDLHTTNGSAHGYHLTYAPSLSTNVDPGVDHVARQVLLPEVRRRMEAHYGFRTFDYGNFSGRNERAWVTYDHRPRFGTNYMGIRGRFSILSEAYSYIPFEERIAVTTAFVTECLEVSVENADLMRATCARADEDVERGAAWFGYDSTLVDGELGEVLTTTITSVEVEGLGTRRIAGTEWGSETAKVRVAFRARERLVLPKGYVIVSPEPAWIDLLEVHGIAFERTETERSLRVRHFHPTELRKASRLFQGHHEVGLSGDWGPAGEIPLPAGSIVISTAQPHGRLAAQLLDPRSEDSLSTWNQFEARTQANLEGVPGVYPVLEWVQAP